MDLSGQAAARLALRLIESRHQAQAAPQGTRHRGPRVNSTSLGPRQTSRLKNTSVYDHLARYFLSLASSHSRTYAVVY